ncbi:MAG: helix-turn-helix transcriptional regulator [Coprobacillus sp.]|nr:helix-turn-helix transcriptional regulator [Coprobacillus sp.]
MDMMKIGVFLQNLRKDKNFTQQELADCFHVSSKTVSKWECGKALPEIPLLKEISEFYSVSVDEILNGERNIEGAMGNTMRKEEMQKAYQKKKKMWSIFIYVSFFVLLLAFVLLPLISSIKNHSLATAISIVILVVGLFVYGLGLILSKLDKDVQSKSVLLAYHNQRVNVSIWFGALFLANLMIAICNSGNGSLLENIMNVELTLDKFSLDTIVCLFFFGICGLIAQLLANYFRKYSKEKTEQQLGFIYQHHLFFYGIFLLSTLSIFTLPWAEADSKMLLLTQVKDYTFLQTYPTTFYVGIGLYVASLVLVLALYKFPQVHSVGILMLIVSFILFNVATQDLIHQEYNEGGLSATFNSPKGAYIMVGILAVCFVICLTYSITNWVQMRKETK